MKLSIEIPIAHKHSHCPHPCRCAGPKSWECLKCAQARGRKFEAALYRVAK